MGFYSHLLYYIMEVNKMDKQYFEIEGEELVQTNSKGLPLRVKAFSNSAYLLLPKKYIGKVVKVVLIGNENDNTTRATN